MDILKIKNDIVNGKTALGIEFGSTRIKAVLISSNKSPAATDLKTASGPTAKMILSQVCRTVMRRL